MIEVRLPFAPAAPPPRDDAAFTPDFAFFALPGGEPQAMLRAQGRALLSAEALGALLDGTTEAGAPPAGASEPAATTRRSAGRGTGPGALAAPTSIEALAALHPLWSDLPPDAHLLDGGRYRARRHGSFIQTLEPDHLAAVPHRAHWQSTDYNALHGGLLRWFEPLHPAMAGAPAFTRLLCRLGRCFAAVRAPTDARWSIEAHAFRIDTREGVGRPTPEGAHRDGVDFVAVLLVDRCGVRGGETRVFEAGGPHGLRFTLAQPWSALLLDDTRVIHETTPILPEPQATDSHRDTLVLTYRSGGFQDPPG
jgi:hypothetical protein